MPPQQSYRPIRELAKDGDVVFAPESPSHRFGRVVGVTTTHVTYRAIPSERAIAIAADWPAFRNVTDRGRSVVVQASAQVDAFLSLEVRRLPGIMSLPESKVQNLPDVVLLQWVESRDALVNWRVAKMKLTPDKSAVVYNEWLTLAGLPAECFAYRLGNRSALDWVIDQYQVSTDARSGITSDPNRADDKEYIARLVGRVVTVSVETVRLVGELARAVALPVGAETEAPALVGEARGERQ